MSNDSLKNRPLAPDVDIAELLAGSKDIPHNLQVQTTAEVVVPGLYDKESKTMGLRCIVKKASVEDQIVIMSKATAHPEDDDNEYGTKRLASPEARAHWWKCIWQLVLCCERPQISFESALALMTRPDGMDIVDPLLAAINKLQLAKPQQDDVQLFLDDFSIFPELMQQMKAAHRAGNLVEFLSGDDEVVTTIKDWVRTITAVQKIVAHEDADIYAGKIVQKIGEALEPPTDEEDEPQNTEE